MKKTNQTQQNLARRYSVSFESETGKKIKLFFDKAKNADETALSFIKLLGSCYSFVSCDEHTEVVQPERCFGGIDAIILPSDTDTSAIDKFIWASAKTEDKLTAWFPRVYRDTIWMRTDEVVAKTSAFVDARSKGDRETLLKLQQWKLDEADKAFVDERYEIEKMPYCAAKHMITTDNAKMLTDEGESSPRDGLLVTPIIIFRYHHPDKEEGIILPSNYVETDKFTEAINLCEAFGHLPIVKAISLLKIVGIKTGDDKKRVSPVFEWSEDTLAKRYIFKTNMDFDNKDMIPLMK